MERSVSLVLHQCFQGQAWLSQSAAILPNLKLVAVAQQSAGSGNRRDIIRSFEHCGHLRNPAGVINPVGAVGCDANRSPSASSTKPPSTDLRERFPSSSKLPKTKLSERLNLFL
jgi:hypothetical protein